VFNDEIKEIVAFFGESKASINYGKSVEFLQQYRSNLKILNSYGDNKIILLFQSLKNNQQGKLELFFQQSSCQSELIFTHLKISYFPLPPVPQNSDNIFIPSIKFVRKIKLLLNKKKSTIY
jgi:hypothetical protein